MSDGMLRVSGMIIDPKSETPIFRQIAQQVRGAIDARVYRPGESLPSLRALALEIRVNPNTVQRAYEELEREGIVESRRGLGVFVVDREKLTTHGQLEREALAALRKAVVAGIAKGMTPVRMRELFESVLSTSIERARRR